MKSNLKNFKFLLNKLNYFLKKSEESRADLVSQLEMQKKQAEIKEKESKYFSSPTNANVNDLMTSNFIESSELFSEIRNIINDIVDSFKYPKWLFKLSLSEDKSIKKIMTRLERFKLFNTFGFVNILAKILSIKVTCERLLSKTNNQERSKMSTVNIHYKSVENPKTTKSK